MIVIKTIRHKSLSKEFYSHMKNNIINDPLNPPKGDFRTVQVKQNTATERLTPPLRGGWEGS
jgi:hypothetical protein